jgi:hypothetical protein
MHKLLLEAKTAYQAETDSRVVVYILDQVCSPLYNALLLPSEFANLA